MRAVDAAAAAGVSTTIVFFIPNGRDVRNISATTRARVLKAAEELGYCPNHIVRSLWQCSISSIGLVTDAVAPFPSGGRLLATATETAEASGQVPLMMDVGHRTGRVGEVTAALGHRQADAIIYAIMRFTELTETPEPRTPLVLVSCAAPTLGPSSVSPDDIEGVTATPEHLADLGHQRVVMLDGHCDSGNPNSSNISGPIRWDAFRRAIERCGVEVRHVGTGWQIDNSHAAALTALDAPPDKRPATLFIVCNRIAVGALFVTVKFGLDVPGDVPIVGFDDREALAGHTVPALVTVVLPRAAIREATVRTALSAVSGGSETPEHLVSSCLLVVRGSTAPPPMDVE